MPCRTCTGVRATSLSAHGFPPSTLREGWSGTPEDWPELDALGADELRDVEWAGVPIGRLVEIPVKWFLMGASADPMGPLTTRRFLRSARRVVDGAVEALDRIRPDIVVLLNGLFFFESIVASCAGSAASTSSPTSAASRRRRSSSGATCRPAWATCRDLFAGLAGPAADAERERRARRLPRRPPPRPPHDRPLLGRRAVRDARRTAHRPAGHAVHQPHLGLGGHRPGARVPVDPGVAAARHRRVRPPARARAPHPHPPGRGEAAGQADPGAARRAHRCSTTRSSRRTCGSSAPTTRRARTR